MKKTSMIWLLVVSLLICIPIVNAGETAPAEMSSSETPPVEIKVLPKVDESLSNPRQTMNTFLSAMQAVSEGKKQQISTAVATLALDNINELIRKDKGKELAQILSSVIERSKKVVLSSIDTNPKVGRYVFGTYSQGKVEIVKQIDGRWLFSKETVSDLPSILEGLLIDPAKHGAKDPQKSLPFHIRLRAKMPEVLKGGFLLEYWQWIGLFIIIFIASLADKIVSWSLARNVKNWKQKFHALKEMDDTVLRPLGLMAMALIWWLGLKNLGLPSSALVILSIAVKLLVSLSFVWSAFRLVDILDLVLMNKARLTSNKFDDLFVPMIRKTLKVFVAVIGFIFIANNLNVNVSSLLAGLGIGGLAFAFASKDLIGNLLGSVTVLLDRPFSIGDWIVVGDVEGTVEDVGFRSTRIRTFYNSLITLPNGLLTNTKIDNMGERRYRRMKTMLNLTYDTSPEKIDAFCEGVRALIRLHPYMRKDYYEVYFNAYNSASLDILIYVFWATPDWNMELRERHRFLLDILRLSKQLGVEFAYPTQTLYLKQNPDEVEAVAELFKPSMTEAESFAVGQKEAEAIFDVTLGKGVIPGPVKFP